MRALRYEEPVDPDAPNSTYAFALGFVGANKRVLEFGCATGHVSQALRDQGCHVTGIEIDPDAAAIAADRADEVIVVDVEADDFLTHLPSPPYEVAMFGDVLEHLRDPLRVLRATRTVLEPHGMLVVSLPNIAHVDVRLSLLRGHFTYSDIGLLDETHLHFFTRESVDRLLRDAGFVVVAVERVRVPAFVTELGLERDEYDPDLVASILEDPEAETYQFVMKAVLDTGDQAVRELADRCVRLDDELRTAQAEALELRAQLTEANGHLDALRTQVSNLDAALTGLKSSKLFRWTRPLRSLFSR